MCFVLFFFDVFVCYVEYFGFEFFVDFCFFFGNFFVSCLFFVLVFLWRFIVDFLKYCLVKFFIWFVLFDWINCCIMEILIIIFFYYGNLIDFVMEIVKCFYVIYFDIMLIGLVSCIRIYYLRFFD